MSLVFAKGKVGARHEIRSEHFPIQILQVFLLAPNAICSWDSDIHFAAAHYLNRPRRIGLAYLGAHIDRSCHMASLRRAPVANQPDQGNPARAWIAQPFGGF
jgi:hypothetical protein